MANKNGSKRSLIPVQQKWENAGDGVEGILLSKEDTVYAGNTRGRYLIQTGGGLVAFMGGFQIDQAMALVAVGDKIGVEFTGESQGSGTNKMKMFDIWVDDGVEAAELEVSRSSEGNYETSPAKK